MRTAPRLSPLAPRPRASRGAVARAVPDSVASAALFATDTRPVILYDGVCGLCNNAVNLSLDLDDQGVVRYAALQSDVGRLLLRRSGRSADDISSIVLCTRDGSYTKSEAVLRIAQLLERGPLPSSLPVLGTLGLLVPPFLRDAVYDVVADNRYAVFGKTDECRLSDGRFEARFVADSQLGP